jgi:dCMP deaminase
MPRKPGKSRTQEDRQHLDLAFGVRKESDDPKSRLVPQSGVGAIIAMNGEIIAQSANVLPPQLKMHYDRTGIGVQEEDRYHLIEHAERATIFMAVGRGLSLKGATMYTTRFPCSDCARTIVWFGISRLVVGAGLTGEQRWLMSQRAARKILREAGVTLRVLPTST